MGFWSRVTNAFRGESVNRELDDEMAFHMEMRAKDNRAHGMSQPEAEQDARRRFGNAAVLREETRDSDVAGWLDSVFQDLRYAFRTLGRTPVLTGVVVLSLALGIGANTAIFTFTNALLLRSLPVKDPGQIHQLFLTGKEGGRGNPTFNYPIFRELRADQKIFDGMVAWSEDRFDAASGGEARMLDGAYVNGEMFETLGLRPALGRGFTPGDDTPEGAVAVLSHNFWKRQFGSDPAVLEKTLRLSGKPFRIIGVAPEGFNGMRPGGKFDVMIPTQAQLYLQPDTPILKSSSYWWLEVFGRLKPGMTEAQGAAAIQALAQGVLEKTRPTDIPQEFAKGYTSQSLTIRPAARGTTEGRGTYRTAVVILNVVVGLVLLIACANIANLLLARATAREREMAVRIALGASRRRVIRQLLTESMLLSFTGGALGLAIAPAAANLLLRASTTPDDRLYLDVTPDPVVLGFTFFAAVLCGVLFGAAPAWRASRVAPHPGLRESSGTVSDRRGRLRQGLVLAQVSLSVVLLVGSVLFLQTFWKLLNADHGFQQDKVLMVRVSAERTGLKAQELTDLRRITLERLKQTPGVASAAAVDIPPVSNIGWNGEIELRDAAGSSSRFISWFNLVSDDYFKTIGTPLMAGRTFGVEDSLGARKVLIVNEQFARKAFGGRNAVGQVVYTRGGTRSNPVWEPVEIVGMVKDTRYRRLREKSELIAYLPYSQEESAGPRTNYVLRSAGDMPSLIASVKTAITEVNPNLGFTLRPLTEQIENAMIVERLLAGLCLLFGLMALFLSALGLFGLLSYSVAQRKGEIGLRMALGATPSDVVRLVIGQSSLIVVLGAGAGAGLAAWASPYAADMLYGVQATDPSIYALCVGILLVIAAGASWLPALRATRLDPVQSLRHE